MKEKKLDDPTSVAHYLATLEHPLKLEIEQLRALILETNEDLTENIKWNAPNFCLNGEDRITMRIHPPKQLQLIFHRGAKVQEQPKDRLISDNSGLLTWKTNDRAVATFANSTDILAKSSALSAAINAWLRATAAG